MNKKKWLLVIFHIMVWTLFFTIPHFMRPEPRPHAGMPMRMAMPIHSEMFWIGFYMLQNALLIPFFYLNVLYLMPGFLPRKRYGFLLGAELILGAILYGYSGFITSILLPRAHGGPGAFMPLLTCLVVLSVAFGYYSFSESEKFEKQQKDRENESLKTELQFLRWQISPHFLFNALNNMVALARKKSDTLEPMLINLSGIMRYMLYETDEAKVTLQKETQYLKSYIHLQSLRYDNIELDINIDLPESPEYFIEPMLLIPFVENAFKHGIDMIEQPVIRMSLHVADGELHFMIANKYLPGNRQSSDDAKGIGMVNVRKRLALLYEGRHRLETRINGWLTVSLKISLH